MDKERVHLNCNAARAELYLEAIDGFPSDIYSEEDMRFRITVNRKAAVLVPILPKGDYRDLNVPAKGINDAKVIGSSGAIRFKCGNFLYEARSSSDEDPNDGAGNLEKLSDSGSKD